jgi:hypothetical protein
MPRLLPLLVVNKAGRSIHTTMEDVRMNNDLLQVSCPNHISKTVSVKVLKDQLRDVEVILDQAAGQDEGYHTYTQIQKQLWHLNSEYPKISRLYR